MTPLPEGKQLTRHADASECSALIQAGTVILAGIRVAFVDVDFATRPGESAGAVAAERAGRVDAKAVVLARRACLALVNIVGAINAFVSVGAGAHVGAVDGARVANGARVAWVGSAGIVQMAQQTRFT